MNDQNPKSENTVSPIPAKLCGCGCQTEFIPKRTNQLFLNAKHRDYNYNHRIRKENNKPMLDTNKALSKNLRILKKYYELNSGKRPSFTLAALKKEGFEPSQLTGVSEQEGTKFSFCYNYAFQILIIKNQEHIKIYKNENT